MDANLIYLIIFIVIALTGIGLGVGLGIGLSKQEEDEDEDVIPEFIDKNGIFIAKRLGKNKKYKPSIFADEYVKEDTSYRIYTNKQIVEGGLFYPDYTTWETGGHVWPPNGAPDTDEDKVPFSPYLLELRGGIAFNKDDEEGNGDEDGEGEGEKEDSSACFNMFFQFNPKISLEALKQIHDNHKRDECNHIDDLIKDVKLGLKDGEDVVINYENMLDKYILYQK